MRHKRATVEKMLAELNAKKRSKLYLEHSLTGYTLRNGQGSTLVSGLSLSEAYLLVEGINIGVHEK